MDRVKILLVDDQPRNLDSLEAILSDGEYQLLRANDADSALRHLLSSDDVAAIILDIQMPRINGLELARIIKGTKKFRQIPILFLTAHMVDDQDVLSGYGAGAVDYLTKPFNPQILKHKVAVFADLFRKTRALAELNEKLDERVQERTNELEKSEAALRAAAQQKDEFLAVLAHELRNPLAPLRTGVDLLLQVLTEQPPTVSKTLTVMNRQLDHIVRLIDDLLDVSRISRGVLELKRQPGDLAELVRRAVDTFRALFDQRKISVEMTLEDGLRGNVDGTRIAQIVGNVLHNASKYTPPGGRVTVTLTHEGPLRAGSHLRQRHGDSLGAARARLRDVRAYRAPISEHRSGRGNRPGAGQAAGANAWRRSGRRQPRRGAGHDLSLTLPTIRAAAVHEPEDTPLRNRRLTTPLDIVLIEDIGDVAEALSSWLQALGHHVKVAHTGPTGLALALDTRPDVVLCDIGLPEMNGVEVCRQVREQAHDFRPTMIALTGWGKDEDRKKTIEAGFDHHLVKPVAMNLLRKMLDNVQRR